MSANEQKKPGTGQRLSQGAAKCAAVIRKGFDAMMSIGDCKCDNCAKTASIKRDGHFCSDSCYFEFQSKVQAYAQGHPLCCLPGCQKQCYYDQGRHCYREFCGKTHGQKFKLVYESTHLYVIAKTESSGQVQLHSSASPAQGIRAYHQQGHHSVTYGHHSGASAGATYTHTIPSAYATNEPIHFYHNWQPYYEFTNFAPYPILFAEQQWPTSEHFFQAQKFIGTPLVEVIRRCTTPREAFDISRSELGTKWLRKDWSEEKVNVMKLALRAKFTQHQFLHDLLLSTGDHQLVEHTSRDSFWGDGGDGRGQNKLGQMLMELRQELKCNKLKTRFTFPWEATQGTPPYPSGSQPTTSSQNVQPLHPTQQSYSHGQAPHHRHEHASYGQGCPSYSDAVKNHTYYMDCN